MKINPGWRPLGKDVKLPEHPSALHSKSQNFSDLMQQQDERASQEQLKRMLQQIDKQGDFLAKTLTVRALRQYRLLVKQFLEETVRKGVQLKDAKSWDRRGRTKRYKLLDEVDRSLLDMADEMLEHEQGKIEILHKIGEIRGMLINLFF